MQIRFWGTRGSIPAPGPQTVKFGGNTSCVEVRTTDGTHIVLDCGSGARALGQHLFREGRSTAEAVHLQLLVGHTHWDHIQGFPFFLPAFSPNVEVNVYAPSGFQRTLEDSLAGQMQYSYFPVRLQELQSRMHFTELEEGFFRVGSVLVETQHLNHTNPTLAYRITADGATIVYSTDHEPFWIPGGLDFHHPGDQRHVAFLEGADLIIHDAQYTASEYPERFGWGHSTFEYATDVAIAAGARRLALFHHDPSRDDAAVEAFEAEARRRVEKHRSGLEVFAACEGLAVDVQGSRPMPDAAGLSAQRRRPIAGSRVLIVGGSEAEGTAIARELEEESLICSRAATRAAALVMATHAPPDIAIVQAHLPDGTGADLAQPLRDKAHQPMLPVIVLTERSANPDGQVSLLGATDYLAKPYSPPMLRSRVRAWLARAVAEAPGPPAGAQAALATGSARRTPGAQIARLSPSELKDLIASIRVFGSLKPEQIDVLSRRARVASYEAGKAIVDRGRGGDSLFVVLSGRVRLLEPADDPEQHELVLAELGQGEVFGEVGSLPGERHAGTVLAAERTRCLVIPAEAFSELLREGPGLAMALLRLLAGRMHETDRRLARYAPDPLTGLPRRKAFQDLYPHVAAQARRAGVSVLLGLVDVVNLRGINDRFGYSVGDEVVRAVADALRGSARRSDLIARWGGDELVVLLVGARLDTMDRVAGRVRKCLGDLGPTRGIPESIECAVGIAFADIPPDTAEPLLLAADRDMQTRKAARKP